MKDDVDRAFCDHLEAVDEDLDCDADEADAEFCARLLTPSLRAALDDDNVRAQFRCGGAARRGLARALFRRDGCAAPLALGWIHFADKEEALSSASLFTLY